MASYVIAAPEALAAASADLTGIEEAIKGAAAAAAPSTTGILAAAGDEVSAAIAKFFGSHADGFQALNAQTTLFQAQFERALRAAGEAYAAAEAANVSPLLQQVESLGLFSPIELLIGRQLFGGAGPGFVGPRTATLGALLNSATNAVGLGGVVNFPSTVALAGPNGVTGVRIGFSFLQIPISSATFLGIQLPPFSYPAPALWYFPTQADGAVAAVGTTYLQHGFGAIGWLYSHWPCSWPRKPTVPSSRPPFRSFHCRPACG
ncbi:MAG: hypothetical protein QOG37_2421 [Mycobacterium sp.]|nr:hypothetical protein [Mycobacterium sp.]